MAVDFRIRAAAQVGQERCDVDPVVDPAMATRIRDSVVRAKDGVSGSPSTAAARCNAVPMEEVVRCAVGPSSIDLDLEKRVDVVVDRYDFLQLDHNGVVSGSVDVGDAYEAGVASNGLVAQKVPSAIDGFELVVARRPPHGYC